MSTRLIFLIVAGMCILLAVGAFVVCLRSTSRRRKLLTSALSVLLIVASIGAFLLPAPTKNQPAPVDTSLSMYLVGFACGSLTVGPFGCDGSQSLFAMGARDGTAHWKQPAPGTTGFFQSMPLYDQGVVYEYSADANSPDAGVLEALRARDGSLLWRIHVAPGPELLQPYGSNLLEMAIEPGEDPTKQIDLLVLRTSDGQPIRHVRLPWPGPYALDGNVLYDCPDGETLQAVRVEDERILWRTHIKPFIQPGSTCVPMVVNGTIYVRREYDGRYGSDTAITAVREDQGAVLWDYESQRLALVGVGGGLTFIGEQAMAATASSDTLMAFRSTDGSVAWRHTLGEGSVGTYYALAPKAAVVVGDTVYLGGANLLALRLSDGAALWQRTQDGRSFTLIAVAQGVVFATTAISRPGPSMFEHADVLALAATNGATYWDVSTSSDGAILAGS